MRQNSSLFDLEGKLALVTGANKGIGYAIALGLAEAGADIIAASSNIELEDSEIEKAVTSLGRSFNALQVDLENRSSIYEFISMIKDLPIDILVNNAGTIMRSPAAEHSDEYWDRVMNINLDSQFILSREIGAEMIKRGSGKIIFTASLLSFQGGINVPSYRRKQRRNRKPGKSPCQ